MPSFSLIYYSKTKTTQISLDLPYYNKNGNSGSRKIRPAYTAYQRCSEDHEVRTSPQDQNRQTSKESSTGCRHGVSLLHICWSWRSRLVRESQICRRNWHSICTPWPWIRCLPSYTQQLPFTVRSRRWDERFRKAW